MSKLFGIVLAAFLPAAALNPASAPLGELSGIEEFHWDDGVFHDSTGGSEDIYFAVRFDEELDNWDGEPGTIIQLGCAMELIIGQGAWMSVWSAGDDDEPDALLLDWMRTKADYTGAYTWIDVDVPINDGAFFVAWHQHNDTGGYDLLGFDALHSGWGHNWFYDYEGVWWDVRDPDNPFYSTTQNFGDFMLRCRWEAGGSDLEPASWGRIKAR
jgi:hypothetical protein